MYALLRHGWHTTACIAVAHAHNTQSFDNINTYKLGHKCSQATMVGLAALPVAGRLLSHAKSTACWGHARDKPSCIIHK
jgi:hypothetical protein